MPNKKKRQYVGYRMPARFFNKIEELLPIYEWNFSAVLDAILLNWETSEFYRQQQLTIQAMRFRMLEKGKKKKSST